MRFFMNLKNKVVSKAVGFAMGLMSQEIEGGIDESAVVDPEIAALSRKMAVEGSVLLKNNNNVLPLQAKDKFALFGRCQLDYFYVGYGSGGSVRTPYLISPLSAFEESKRNFVKPLADKYKNWIKKNPAYEGFWGSWPRFHHEMPVSKKLAEEIAKEAQTAVIVIGRAAGEDRENSLKKGSFFLTDNERKLLKNVSASFKNTVVLLNIGNIIDLTFIDEFDIDAALIVWQGGMESGRAVDKILFGEESPSGRLTDTVALSYGDYPSSESFGHKDYNFYEEDIFVGYRYFETFKKVKVLYPFGHGLSYTNFDVKCVKKEKVNGKYKFVVDVANVGGRKGKEVAAIYLSKPQGELGNPKRELVAFAKTRTLLPGEIERLSFEIDEKSLASFDDTGKTGFSSSYVLLEGEYKFYLGANVREAQKVYSDTLSFKVVESLTKVCPLQHESLRFQAQDANGNIVLSKEKLAPEKNTLKEEILSGIGIDLPLKQWSGEMLFDVYENKISLDEFVQTLSLEELEAISRGDYTMRSALGAKGNAGVFGGVLESLRQKGVPPVTTSDGPCGLRLSAGCSLLPIGTLTASSWNTTLTKELYSLIGEEMIDRGSDVILGPGMNIHRNMLCGRNFEYFSEDPYLSGKIAAAFIEGVQSKGVAACPKHFACNNQEVNRTKCDSRLSERAMREIYLKGFEIAVKEASPKTIMTSYNLINGVWGHYNYHLVNVVLRKEWGFDGAAITDWWMQYSESPEFPNIRDNAYRVRAGVDVLMPGGKRTGKREPDGTLLETLGQENGITLFEMQKAAKNVLKVILSTPVIRDKAKELSKKK